MKDPTEIAIGGKRLTVSNLDKVLYPQAQFTKGQVIDYYVQVAPVLLPHLKDRPLTLKRYPNGVDREFFYEKRCPEFRPRWVETASLWSKTNEGNISYCLANNLATLVWAANLADLELHTSLARYQKPDRPTMMVFDLDPGPGTDIVDCAEAGIWIRDLLKEMKLESFPKTSGSKGLQIYVPLNTNGHLRRDEALLPRVGGRFGKTKTGTNRRADEQAIAQRQSLHRLEPERRSQDDGLRLFPARQRTADGFDAVAMAGSGTGLEITRREKTFVRRRRSRETRPSPGRSLRARVDAETETAGAEGNL